MFDIEVLRFVWWLLLGILMMGFAVTDGFDFGVAFLLPFVAKNEVEKLVVLNSIGPVWEGNQVWIILGAGAIFAAWPFVYAVAFSGAYFAILLLLLTMGISRPVSFKYRTKLNNASWRAFWDVWIFIGGLVPALLFGILVGNVLLGLPFYFDNDLRIFYSGTFLQLLSPFALWCGVTSLAMLVMHGGLYLAVKTEDPIRARSIYGSRLANIILLIFFIGGGAWITYYVTGYKVIDGVDPRGFSNPLHKHVEPMLGGWLNNYSQYPLTMWVPLLGIFFSILAFLTATWRNSHFAFLCSGLAIVSIIATVGVSMFPFILPSSTNLASSLLVWDSSSTALTLLIMLVAVMIFIPIIMIYTAWVYRVLRGKIDRKLIEDELHKA